MNTDLTSIKVGDEVAVLDSRGNVESVRTVASIDVNGSISLATESRLHMLFRVDDGKGIGRWTNTFRIVPALPEHREAITKKKAELEAQRHAELSRRERPEYKLLKRIAGEIEYHIEKYDSLPMERIEAAAQALGIE